MFTGLVEKKGELTANIAGRYGNRLCVHAPINDLQSGESIAINGVCLTLLPDSSPTELMFDVSLETLDKTTLSQLKKGDFVNIERAMMASSRLGGHYVSGHVDTIAPIKNVSILGDFREMTIGPFSSSFQAYLPPKGSITLDGVSLTINELNTNCIKIMLIPETLTKTTLGERTIGDYVNVEFDYLTRIVAHQLERYNGA